MRFTDDLSRAEGSQKEGAVTPRGFLPCPPRSREPLCRRHSYFQEDRGSLRDGWLVGCRILAAPSTGEMEIWEKPTSEFKPLGWSQNRAEANPGRLRGAAERGREESDGGVQNARKSLKR